MKRRRATLGILLLLGLYGLKLASSVMLPLALAFFFIALVWPLQRRVAERTGPGAAAALSTLVVAGVSGLLLFGIARSLRGAAREALMHRDTLARGLAKVENRLGDCGIEASSVSDQLGALVEKTANATYEVGGGAVLVLAFVSFGLYEIPAAKRKLEVETDNPAPTLRLARQVATQARRYLLIRTVIGALTGLLCALGGWLIGLELWWLWGVLNFLLNYIPTLGSFLGILPPVIIAYVQPDGGIALAGLAMLTVGGCQLLMGVWIDPLVQGAYLTLSPLVVLASVVLWGWIWGPTGAFIGVPLTLTIAVIARERERWRWLATALAAEPAR